MRIASPISRYITPTKLLFSLSLLLIKGETRGDGFAQASELLPLGGKRRYGNSVSVKRHLQERKEDEALVLWPQKPLGDLSCPCLTKEELEAAWGINTTTSEDYTEIDSTGRNGHKLSLSPPALNPPS